MKIRCRRSKSRKQYQNWTTVPFSTKTPQVEFSFLRVDAIRFFSFEEDCIRRRIGRRPICKRKETNFEAEEEARGNHLHIESFCRRNRTNRKKRRRLPSPKRKRAMSMICGKLPKRVFLVASLDSTRNLRLARLPPRRRSRVLHEEKQEGILFFFLF